MNKMFNKQYLDDVENPIPKEVKAILEAILSKNPTSLTVTEIKTLQARKVYISDEYIKAFGLVEVKETKTKTNDQEEAKTPSFNDMKEALKAANVEIPKNANKEVVTELYNKLPAKSENSSDFETIVKELTELGVEVSKEATLEEVTKMLADAKANI